MPDRIAHDHPTVETVAATVSRDGPTRRVMVTVTAELAVEPGDLVRLVIDGTEYRAPVEDEGNGVLGIRHAARSPSEARAPGEADNALLEWLEEQGFDIGGTLHLDVVEPGFRYGLRGPGESAVYQTGKPDDSLAAIARQVEETDADQ
jgi:hypothetical protein